MNEDLKKEFEEFAETIFTIHGGRCFTHEDIVSCRGAFEKVSQFLETAITKAYKRGFNDGKKYCVRIIWKDPAQKVLNEHLITKAREEERERIKERAMVYGTPDGYVRTDRLWKDPEPLSVKRLKKLLTQKK